MHRVSFLLILLLTSSALFAQDDEFKTIFNQNPDKPLKVSGFGGPFMMFTGIAGDYAHMMGGGGAIIINNVFFGGYGLGLTTSNYYKNTGNITGDSTYLGYGHGGFWVGYILAPKKAIHISVSSLIGWGGIMEYVDYDDEPDDTYAVFVFTPVIEAELNFSKFFKVGLGTSLSLVKELKDDSGYSTRDFLSPSAFLSFKFGWFE